MKTTIITIALLFTGLFVSQAQTINPVPTGTARQLPNGWHKYIDQGTTFDVEVLNGALVQGNIKWFDGSTYSGALSYNGISGKGTYTWPDGQRYEGAFKNNARHGKGTMYSLDGTKYGGKWKNDKKNGKGTVFSSEGDIVQKGVWAADEFLGDKKKR